MADDREDSGKKRWLPLESNPDVSYYHCVLVVTFQTDFP